MSKNSTAKKSISIAQLSKEAKVKVLDKNECKGIYAGKLNIVRSFINFGLEEKEGIDVSGLSSIKKTYTNSAVASLQQLDVIDFLKVKTIR